MARCQTSNRKVSPAALQVVSRRRNGLAPLGMLPARTACRACKGQGERRLTDTSHRSSLLTGGMRFVFTTAQFACISVAAAAPSCTRAFRACAARSWAMPNPRAAGRTEMKTSAPDQTHPWRKYQASPRNERQNNDQGCWVSKSCDRNVPSDCVPVLCQA